MILQALYDYYERKASDPDGGIAPEGFEHKEIPFVIVIDESGNLVQIEDTRYLEGKKLRSKRFLVPQSEKRSGNVKPYLLWDNAEHIFGVAVKNTKEQVAKYHAAFIKRIKDLDVENDLGISAVLKFLSSAPEENLEKSEYVSEIKEQNSFLAFRLNTDVHLVSERQKVIDAITSQDLSGDKKLCLVTGNYDVIARLHPAIKGVRGTNTSGGDIVSFNEDAFTSFQKSQGNNAPIGYKATFAYTTALNHLLGKDSKQKIQVGDATAIFWAEKSTCFESDFSAFFDEPPKDNPDRLTDAIRALYQSIGSGILPIKDVENRFFVLGLSPNAARISIRFWNAGTVAEFSQRIKTHFDDIDIDHRSFAMARLPLKTMLRAIAPLNDVERIPPNLAGDWTRAIFSGLTYPDTLMQMALRKIRSHRDESKMSKVKYEIEVEYPCVSIIKAYLNRKSKFQHQQEKEMTVSLDKENRNTGYRLGRLFALLEKIQEEANQGINATIRDRYYSAVSGAPASVLPILMRLKNHHLAKLAKLEKGRTIYFERLIGEVLNEVMDFPLQLNLQDQGRFFIGYYHQRQALFTKSESSVQGE